MAYPDTDPFSDDKLGKPWDYDKKSSVPYVRCYNSHPALPVGELGVIYGGSCITPAVTDADVYIGFDSGMKFTSRQYPWEAGDEVYMPISDMQVPTDSKAFTKLVDWTLLQLIAKRKVHAGCIGGHGRTGMFLSAVVYLGTGEYDAISYVRKHYCPKAVESDAQVRFLGKVFGITAAKATKSYTSSTSKNYSVLSTSSGAHTTGGTHFDFLPSEEAKKKLANLGGIEGMLSNVTFKAIGGQPTLFGSSAYVKPKSKK